MGSVSDRLTTATYLIRRGDDVHTDNLFSQDRFRVDAVESGSKFCVLGQGLNNEKCGLFSTCCVVVLFFVGQEGREDLVFDALGVEKNNIVGEKDWF